MKNMGNVTLEPIGIFTYWASIGAYWSRLAPNRLMAAGRCLSQSEAANPERTQGFGGWPSTLRTSASLRGCIREECIWKANFGDSRRRINRGRLVAASVRNAVSARDAYRICIGCVKDAYRMSEGSPPPSRFPHRTADLRADTSHTAKNSGPSAPLTRDLRQSADPTKSVGQEARNFFLGGKSLSSEPWQVGACEFHINCLGCTKDARRMSEG